MGQDITYILTKQRICVPIEIVHFIKNTLTIIPLDVSDFQVEDFINLAKENSSLNKIENHIDRELDWNDELNYIIKTITRLNLTDFLLEHNSEWADMPISCFSICF